MTDFSALRATMVDSHIRPSDVVKYPVIEAMQSVPREAFVPEDKRAVAYAGDHLGLAGGRVVMDARVLAKMLDVLNIAPRELVLEIGCGRGYATAVIAHMAEAVIAVEEDAGLADAAEANLAGQSVDNAVVINADLGAGAPKHGPYDVITFGGGVEVIPDALVGQLKDGGRMAAIFRSETGDRCRLGLKTAGRLVWRDVFDASVPVLPGLAKKAEFAF